VPGRTLACLADNLDHGRLTVFTAHVSGDLAGLVATVALPASLCLSSSWQLRDLYVVPAARRSGAARALLDTVRAAAVAAGAIRLFVQTEPGNADALALYDSSGFLPVDDLRVPRTAPPARQHLTQTAARYADAKGGRAPSRSSG
jgi:GNAT superfamily N-acetyltransferase